MQPSNFDGLLYQLRHWIFSYGFHQKIRSKMNFKKRPKSDFCQKSNFQPYSDALRRLQRNILRSVSDGFAVAEDWGVVIVS